MKIKKRLISALLALVTLVGILPTASLAATTTGKGIKPTTDTEYWVARRSSSGNSFIHKPPEAAGKKLFCLDFGYAYSSSNSTFLNSYNYTSATGRDADALLAEATAGSGLSELDAATLENAKWFMSYLSDHGEREDRGAVFMAIQTYIWEHQNNKIAGADNLGDVDGGGFANADTYDYYHSIITQLLGIKAAEDAQLQAEVESYAAQGMTASIVEDDSQKWAVLATSSKSGRQMFFNYHSARKVVPGAPEDQPDLPDDPEPETPETPPKKVIFKKVKAGTTQGLDGAAINIYVDGQIVGSEVTANGGIIEYEAPVDTLVTFVERAAPEGYATDPTPHSAFVREDSTQEELTVVLENDSKPSLRVTKVDGQTGDKIAGAVFSIKAVIGDFSTSVTTDGNGTAVVEGLDCLAVVVREESVPEPYVRVNTEQTIALQPGHESEATFTNYKKPGLEIIKRDMQTGDTIAGASYDIVQIDGSYSVSATTDGNGRIFLENIPVGSFEISETAVPDHYILDTLPKTVALKEGETTTVTFRNAAKPSLKIIKSSADGTPLAGVTFAITPIPEGAHTYDRTTDERGEIVLYDLEPGTFSVVETATLPNHILDETEHHVDLIAGKDAELRLTNDRRPNLTVHKEDADTGEPIANTVFTVKAADGHTIDEIRTGVNGNATLENMLPGVYEIFEKSVPSTYLQDAPSQLVTLYANEDNTVNFKNHKKPSLTINKVDSITGSPIRGAKFQIWYGSNHTNIGSLNNLGTYFTNENGQIVRELLQDGWYRVTELEPASGFSIKQPATQEFFIKGGENKVVTFQNTPLNAIVVQKYDSVTGEALGGCTFQLRYLGGASGTGGTIIGQKVTGGNGMAIWTSLRSGAYLLEELDPGDGYSIIQSSETVYLEDNGEQSVVTVRFENAPDGILLIRKVCATNPSVTLANAEFKIAYADGTLIGDNNGIYRTDENGEIRITGLKPGKSVVATEVQAPPGFDIDTQSQAIQIKEGRTVSLTFKNQPHGKLIIQKRDSLTGEPLPGAEFRITTAAGCEVGLDGVIGTSTLTQNGIFTTDAQGEIRVSNLSPGALILTEVKAPRGYVIDTPSTNVVIGTGGDTQTVVIKNSRQGTLIINKKDSVTGEPLEGVEFLVKKASGEVVSNNGGLTSSNGVYFTNKDGQVVISGLQSDTYLVTETSTIPGYIIHEATRSQTVVVDSNDTQSITFFNDPTATLMIHKYVEGTNNTPLAGVEFKVVDGNGGAVGNSDGVYYTDAQGCITIPDLEPGITVKAQETKTKDGFILDSTPQDIKIKNGINELTFWNAKAGTLVIKKLDSVTRKPLAGVEFSITYADGSYVDADNGHLSSKGLYWTDSNGEIRVSGIAGTVVVTEEKTIEGYSISEGSRSQTVQVNGMDTQTLYFYNDPVGGVDIIKVNGADKSKRLPGATFEIRKMDDALIDTVTTGDDGRAFLSLDAGSYYAVEVEAPQSFKIDPTPHYFTVQNGKTTTLTVTNAAMSGILIKKIDSATRQGIYGVSFLLYDSTQKPIGQYTSDDRGYVYIEDLTVGRYYLRELENEGYVVDQQLKTVYVKSGETTEVIWENTPITGQIQIWKKSADDNPINGFPAGTPLEGAVFEIYDKANRLVDTVKSNNRGLAVSKQLPLSRYTVKEVQAPAYYGINNEAVTVYLEHSGQIVQIEVLDTSVYTNVSVHKTGYTEVVPGQSLRYTLTEIANNSTVPLDNFYWRDTLPVDAVRLDKVITGTWNARLSYKIIYKTNLSDEFRTLKDNLQTSRNYTIDASAAALGLAANEYVTEITCLFGRVPAGFTQVQTPYLYCNVLTGLAHEYRFANKIDVGGIWQNQWVMANDRWVTIVYNKATAPKLPKTGY